MMRFTRSIFRLTVNKGETMNRHDVFWQFVIALFIAVLSGCARNNMKADLVLKNGRFYTVCRLKSRVQAIAIKEDRILYTGSDGEIERFIGPETEVIDLEGRFGCPGFNDAHCHFFESGFHPAQIDIHGMTSMRDIQRCILHALRKLPPGSWIVGRGWDQNLFPEGQWPTRQALDVIAPNVPIFLERIYGHSALVNKKALQIAGITKETPDPPGGEIIKDPVTGMPTGILKESAMQLVSQYISQPSDEEIEKAIEGILKQALRFGITSVQDYSPETVHKIYDKFLKENKLTCRISLWFPLQEDLKTYYRLKQKYNNKMLHFGLLKGFCDGDMGSYTAFFYQPYLNDPETLGIPRMSQADLNFLVLQADKEGFQIGIHAVGDRANRMALEAFALCQKINGARESRHRIECARALNEQDLIRFNELGIVASMQPAYCMDDIQRAEGQLGRQRCRYTDAWKSLKNSGVILAFGSDSPFMPLNPMLSLYTVVTRQDTAGYPSGGWFPEERLTIEEAIEAYTLGSAYAEFTDDEKGSLEPGKLADIVILDKNLLKVPVREILRTEVVYTILGGKVVYRKDED